MNSGFAPKFHERGYYMKTDLLFLVASFLVCALLFQCGKEGNSQVSGGADVGSINVTSTAFGDGAMIPKKYTCDAQNISPQIAWTGVPAGAKSIALICDDPDAPVGDGCTGCTTCRCLRRSWRRAFSPFRLDRRVEPMASASPATAVPVPRAAYTAIISRFSRLTRRSPLLKEQPRHNS